MVNPFDPLFSTWNWPLELTTPSILQGNIAAGRSPSKRRPSDDDDASGSVPAVSQTRLRTASPRRV